MSAPLTPPECDCRGLPFMPLDVVRLRESDLAALSTGDEFKAAVLLWCASWNQVPAASLPDDERILAKLAGYSLKEWRGLAKVALKGWATCDDGRIYHPVVAEKSLQAWIDRLSHRKRSAKGNAARYGSPFDPEPFDVAMVAAVEHLRLISPQSAASYAKLLDLPQGPKTPPLGTGNGSPKEGLGTEKRSEGTGTGTGIYSSSNEEGVPPSVEGHSSGDQLADLKALPVEKGAWRLAVKVLVERGDLADRKARDLIGKLVKSGLTLADLWSISEDAWANGTLDPVPYLIAAAERITAARLSGEITRPSERQQRAWAEDWRDRPGQWRTYERGPQPGQPGCRVSAAILAEFGFTPTNVVPIGRAVNG